MNISCSILTFLLTAVLLSGCGRSETYVVHSIKTHYPHPGQWSETALVVYAGGSSGPTKEVLCHFPPDSDIHRHENGPWIGPKRVNLRNVIAEFPPDEVCYRCEEVE